MTVSRQRPTTSLLDRLRLVVETVARTNDDYRVNFQSGLKTFPIPFFGNILTAKVLTVGVNPSSNEFIQRDWTEMIDCESLAHRLLTYFEAPLAPHPWFEPWSAALALLNAGYASGNSAHLDLSPRATISMSSVPDMDLFLGMISRDIIWFFQFLQECTKVQLLMTAGTVTDRWYINQFLALHARSHQVEIHPAPQSSDRCALYEWRHLGKNLPLFFSRVGPSDLNRAHVLVENVRTNHERLRRRLN